MNEPAQPATPAVGPNWRERGLALALYAGLSAVAHLVWEIAQLPLYRLWHTASPAELAFAVGHCTGGDVLIAVHALLATLVMLRAWRWPQANMLPVAILAIPLGLAYTAYSEWLNVYVRHAWSYDPAMPTLAILGHPIGVSPLAQWVVVPAAVFIALAVLHPAYIQSKPPSPAPLQHASPPAPEARSSWIGGQGTSPKEQ